LLVLLSFGLVLIATVLLVLGLLVGDGLALIYLSIGLSALAAVILFVAVRVSKPTAAPSSGPAPLLPDSGPQLATTGAASATAVAPAPARAPRKPPAAPTTKTPVVTPPVVHEADESEQEPASDAGEWLAADQGWEEPAADWEEDELDFPIADYDELTEDEILPLLPQLYTDEIDVVYEREAQGQARPVILETLARMGGGAPAAAIYEAESDEAESDEAESDEPAIDEAESEEWRPEPEDDTDEEELVVDLTEPQDEWTADQFPIEGYDELTLGDVYSLLDQLDEDQLVQVREYEAANKRRQFLLSGIDRRLGVEAQTATTPPARRTAAKLPTAPLKRAPARTKKPPAKKAAAKKAAPAKKTAAKKATAAKKTSPAKKATSGRPASGRQRPLQG
jgi:hypothetical protein